MDDLTKLCGTEPTPVFTERECLLKKYDIPIHHLDFEYVENCKNAKELEKILHILQSGQEGHYPQLMQTTEECLAKIKPNSKYIRKATQIVDSKCLDKEEQTILKDDLSAWLQDVNKSNKELTTAKKSSSGGDLPEIRQPLPQEQPEEKITTKENTRRIKSTDYASWDKYDPDTEILKMDLQTEKLKEKITATKKEITKKERTVKFSTFSTKAEAAFEADREREKGNEYFRSGEYKHALTHYTNSINFLPSVNNYNNRAMTNIKLKNYENAIKDCQAALKYDRNNIKALLRLSQSKESLNELEDALDSAEKAVKIDPNNTTGQNIINRLKNRMQVVHKSPKTRMKIVEITEITEKPEKVVAQKSILKRRHKHKQNVLLPIPGPSNMPEPYFLAVANKDPNIIKQQEFILNNRPQMLYMTNVDGPDDDCECLEIHVRKPDSKYCDRNMDKENGRNCNKENRVDNCSQTGVLIRELNCNSNIYKTKNREDLITDEFDLIDCDNCLSIEEVTNNTIQEHNAFKKVKNEDVVKHINNDLIIEDPSIDNVIENSCEHNNVSSASKDYCDKHNVNGVTITELFLNDETTENYQMEEFHFETYKDKNNKQGLTITELDVDPEEDKKTNYYSDTITNGLDLQSKPIKDNCKHTAEDINDFIFNNLENWETNKTVFIANSVLNENSNKQDHVDYGAGDKNNENNSIANNMNDYELNSREQLVLNDEINDFNSNIHNNYSDELVLNNVNNCDDFITNEIIMYGNWDQSNTVCNETNKTDYEDSDNSNDTFVARNNAINNRETESFINTNEAAKNNECEEFCKTYINDCNINNKCAVPIEEMEALKIIQIVDNLNDHDNIEDEEISNEVVEEARDSNAQFEDLQEEVHIENVDNVIGNALADINSNRHSLGSVRRLQLQHNDNGAGGEPFTNNNVIDIRVEEVHMPYSFLKMWTSAKRDNTYIEHAEVLRHLDFNRLTEVIGYKLDGTMLSDILHTLYNHFTVVHEIDRVNGILNNITTMPRFNIIALFLSRNDKIKLNCLFEFLEQHGKPLASNIKLLYM